MTTPNIITTRITTCIRKKNNKNESKSTKNNEDNPTFSFAQMEGKCWCCGKMVINCHNVIKHDLIPKEDWVMNKTQMAHAMNDNNSSEALVASAWQSKDTTGRVGVHVVFTQDGKH